MITPIDALTIDPRGPVRAAVIWLHGLGADKHDFEPFAAELNLPAELGVRFVFPNAPVRPVTINSGMRMRAWYDIYGFGAGLREDEAGIRESEATLRALVDAQKALGLPATKIVVAGFSQGGAIALQTGLRYAEPLAGILALSTYLPLAAAFESERSAASASTPIWMGHGSLDMLIPTAFAKVSRKTLEKMGYSVEWHEYPMEHSVCMEEIRDIAEWLGRVLA